MNAGANVEQREPFYIAGRNVNWCSHYGKQCGVSLKNIISFISFYLFFIIIITFFFFLLFHAAYAADGNFQARGQIRASPWILVGSVTCWATMGNPTIDFRIVKETPLPTSGHISGKDENSNLKRCIYSNVYSSTIYNSQDIDLRRCGQSCCCGSADDKHH